MTDPSQPDWPLRFVTLPDGTVQFAEAIQASDRDLEARAAIVICTPKEHRDDEPNFGVSQIQWQQGAIDTNKLASEIVSSDPDLAGVVVRETVDPTNATARAVSVAVPQGS